MPPRIPTRAALRCPSGRLFSTSYSRLSKVELAYTRHDPHHPTTEPHSPILLMHGLFGSQRNNRTMSKVLARDLSRPVYTLDLRNHGDSPHAATHTYTSMAEDVEAFISTHSIPTPILIGHSMGAKVAMTMALRHPTAYSALIPVDNAPIDAALKSDFGAYVTAMKKIEDARPPITKQSEADAILAEYEKEVSIRQFLLTNLVKGPVATAEGNGQTKPQTALRWRIPLQTLAKSLPDMADFPFRQTGEARYEGPTLIVRGTKSHYVSDESLPVIGSFFPRFELLDIEAGHWVMSEKFEEFRAGAVEWIKRVVDRE
ncbi:uncharacterized protein HMPREF1541_04891 [Cyphellophora europaea CBS 101466]|uniref:AB hydrolase-1 domain-containing protein n=1 Tax=Cyphellophora europaea (strain CBS 101466) TaxID=1220924 RepID=W2RY58_CYPE1|nr:uncharacterized protein HMPREF1541_04891 [Cyphellophora europaea CBS 101466]ETN40614.1 hypothetical protein HMPREF1541_04891 [Cyphellophora europaea CBS 101466]